jgi:hypothetical protein
MKKRNPGSPIYLLTHGLVFVIGMSMVIVSRLPRMGEWTAVVLLSVGTSLIAAGITGWVIYSYVRQSQHLTAAIEMVTQFGFVAAFLGRSVKIREQYDERMKRFTKSADVIGFGLSAFRQDNIQLFPIWKKQGRIRILLLDPEFPSTRASYADQRDAEENDPPGTIARQVRQFVRETASLLEPGHFEVRLYRCLPMINIFRIDDEVLWGPYLMKEQSRNSPTFVVRAGGEMFGRLTSHFERIWSDPVLSREIPGEWLRPTEGPENRSSTLKGK